jgi:hypothetical protein
MVNPAHSDEDLLVITKFEKYGLERIDSFTNYSILLINPEWDDYKILEDSVLFYSEKEPKHCYYRFKDKKVVNESYSIVWAL